MTPPFRPWKWWLGRRSFPFQLVPFLARLRLAAPAVMYRCSWSLITHLFLGSFWTNLESSRWWVETDPIPFDYITLSSMGCDHQLEDDFVTSMIFKPQTKEFFPVSSLFALAQTKKHRHRAQTPRSTCGCFRQSGHHPGRFRPGENSENDTFFCQHEKITTQHRPQPYGLPMDGWLGGGDVQFFFLCFLLGPFWWFFLKMCSP